MKCLNPTIIYNRGCDYYLQSGKGVLNTSLPLSNYIHKPMWAVDPQYFHRIFNAMARTLDRFDLANHFIQLDSGTIPLFIQVPCGKCEFCKDNKRREWQTRCTLESASYHHNPTMLTLTYDNEHLPKDGVSVRDVNLFFKRLRITLKRKMHYDPKGKLRYCVASEYGSGKEYKDRYGRTRRASQRPHYHLLMWGLPNQAYVVPFDPKSEVNALWQDLILEAWGNCQPQSFQCETARDASGRYVAKYVTKECFVPLGKNKPFFHSSRFPAIGWRAYEEYVLPVVLAHPTSPVYSFPLNGQVRSLQIPSYFLRKTWKPYCMMIPRPFQLAVKKYTQNRAMLNDILRSRKDTFSRYLDLLDSHLDERIQRLSGKIEYCGRHFSDTFLQPYLNHRFEGSALDRCLNGFVDSCNEAIDVMNSYVDHPRLSVEYLEEMLRLIPIKLKFSQYHRNTDVYTDEELQDMLVQYEVRRDNEKRKEKEYINELEIIEPTAPISFLPHRRNLVTFA